VGRIDSTILALTESVRAAPRAKARPPRQRYRQLGRRRGDKKAIIAIADDILITSWQMLSTDHAYLRPRRSAARRARDRTPPWRRHPPHRLGHKATLELSLKPHHAINGHV